jgi:hypothetical protein
MHRFCAPRSHGLCLALCAALAPLTPVVAQDASGMLSTPGGVTAGGNYAPPPGGHGYKITWDVTENDDGTWHYNYMMTREDGDCLIPEISHIIIQLSENIAEGDIFNVGGDIDPNSVTFGTFGEHPSNPGFPEDESIFGVKFDLLGDLKFVFFDSNRAPMWGDFYSKGGSESFAYNNDLGVLVANPTDYLNPAVDDSGALLDKILVPDTRIPEPATLTLTTLLAATALRRRR